MQGNDFVMIVDTLSNINIYESLSKNIFAGLKFLKDANANVNLGIHEINPNTKAIVEEYETQVNPGKLFESHKRVIDIQYPIIGLERIFWSPIRYMDVFTPYCGVEDRTYFINPDRQGSYVDIGAEVFAVFFENDGHCPKNCTFEQENIKKITVKVSI